MKLRKLVKPAWRTLGARRRRSVLAVVGVTIGVGAVVAVVSIGQGTRAELIRQIEELGSNLVVITPGTVQVSAARRQEATEARTLTPEDAEAIQEQVPGVALAVPAHSASMELRWQDATVTTTVVATTPAFVEARNFRPARGRFFDLHDMQTSARVVALGQTVAEALFAGGDPLEATVRIGRAPFTVIAVMEEKGEDIGGQDQDDQVFIPLDTGLRRLFAARHVTAVFVQVAGREHMDAVETETAGLLRQRHRLRESADDDFNILSQYELIAGQEHVSRSFTLLLTSVGGISLLVGGVGILAVMLMSVRERRREIGLRRAVGATRRDILVQFLLEAGVLSTCGGLAGVMLGFMGAAVTAAFTQWGMALSWPAALGATAFAVAVGVGFGVYPAWRASMLDPIEALRAR